MRKIQWKKGNGSMLLGALICALGIFLMAGVAESINLFQASVYAQTRASPAFSASVIASTTALMEVQRTV